VIRINIEKALKNSDRLKSEQNSSQVLLDSFGILKPKSTKDFLRRVGFITIELWLAWRLATQTNTIELANDIIKIIIPVLVALISVVFTGYSIFQALINDKLLIALSSVDKGNLYTTNKYFAEVLIYQIACIIVDILLVVFLITIPKEWCLFINNLTNHIFTVLFLAIILYCNIEAIWEIKSFIFNVFQLFNLHAYARIVEMKEKKSKTNMR
jgi:hypothetical protein